MLQKVIIVTVCCSIIAVVILMLPGMMNRRRQTAVFADAFESYDGSLPEFDIGVGYGFPTFTITFESEAEMKKAESAGCVIAFKDSIQELCRSLGDSDNPFDVNLAVSITYKGEPSSGVQGKKVK